MCKDDDGLPDRFGVSSPRITHELKTWPELFEQTRNGRKKFELRRNDRGFEVGDQLLLKEWDPKERSSIADNGYTRKVVAASHYTGRELLVRVDYIMTYKDAAKFDPGFLYEDGDSDYVIMSISHVN